MESAAEQLLELDFQEDTAQVAAPRSTVWDPNRGDSTCAALSSPTVTAELLSPQAGVAGDGLGMGHSPEPRCPVRDRMGSETLCAGGTSGCSCLCWAFGCKHPAQRRMSGAPSGRNFPCAQALPELSKRISLAAYKYRRTFLHWHHCCVLWCAPDHRKIVTGGV